jgi:low affinity Fe/Cu permease
VHIELQGAREVVGLEMAKRSELEERLRFVEVSETHTVLCVCVCVCFTGHYSTEEVTAPSGVCVGGCDMM